ncbi:MAG: glycosyltransferase [Bacteroidetes bacterium]|nr:glycosyltransferase [Bacteroidota bacterium]
MKLFIRDAFQIRYFCEKERKGGILKVLVCPLDWGIGHATRCVPVIREFLESGDEVVIAADGRPYEFLKKEFPECRMIRFKGAHISYSKGKGFLIKIIGLSPFLLRSYFREQKKIQELIRIENPSVIVSDNRYGLWKHDRFSILITHQLRIILPAPVRFLTGFINRMIHRQAEKFRECWVPDFELHNGLAGQLSHPPELSKNMHYIGTLSRFSMPPGQRDVPVPCDFDIMVALSGPEPQRTLFEEIVFKQLQNTGLSGIIVRGLTETNEEWNLTDKIKVFSHLETGKMKEYILRSHIVICRSGYSSLMDLVTLGKNAILVPTPGQTEQEYLARYLMEKKIYFSMQQDHFELLYAIEMTRNFPGLVMQNDYKILKERIREIRKGLGISH